MPDLDFESYLNLLTRFLRLSGAQRDEIRRELRSHLTEAIEAEMARGASRDEAILRVLDDFGDAAELAARFSSLNARKRWIMKGTAAAACVGFAVLSLNMFSDSGAPRPVSADSGRSTMTLVRAAESQGAGQAGANAADAAVYAALGKVIPHIALDEVPLSEAMEFLRQQAAVNLHVQWNRLESVGVQRDASVNLKLDNLPIERVLRLLLEEVVDENQLAYQVQEGILVISTREHLAQRLVMRIYDVRDLLDSAVEWPTSTNPAEPAQQPSAFEPRKPAGRLSVQDALQRLVTECVSPESWSDNGGRGRLDLFNGCLVVRQDANVQQEVEALLSSIRQRDAGTSTASRAGLGR